ncbi:MAG: hypothetical protein AB1726_05490 [Planctomycetota bacterium]
MRALAFLAAAVLVPPTLPACRSAPAREGAPPPEAGVRLVYEVDPAVAARLGWVAAGASAPEALAAVGTHLELCLDALFPAGEATVGFEGERGLAVTLAVPLAEAEQRILDAALRGIGSVELAIVAEEGDVLSPPAELRGEEERLDAWLTIHPGATLADYAIVPFAAGGPHPALEVIAWRPGPPEPNAAEVDRAVFLCRPLVLCDSFTAGDFARVTPTVDVMGFPAVAFELEEARKGDFLAFTERNVGRFLAIVIEGRLVDSAPRIEEPLPGGGIIRGQFTRAEVDELVRTLGTETLGGPLKLLRIEAIPR